MLDRLFAALQELHAPGGDTNCFGLDSTSAEVHPDGTGARKTNGPQSIGKSRGGWYAKIHMVSASDRRAVIFRLSGGQANDAPEGRTLPESWANPVGARLGDGPRLRGRRDPPARPRHWNDAGRAAEGSNGNMTGKPAKLRNEIERLFRRFKYRTACFTRFDKLDATYRGFLAERLPNDA